MKSNSGSNSGEWRVASGEKSEHGQGHGLPPDSLATRNSQLATVPRDYPPPWGGRGVYPDLCLHMLGILRRPADLADLRRLPGLSHAPACDLLSALEMLEAAGRVCSSTAPTHYGIGAQLPCRDVTVWTLAEGGA